MKKFLTLWIVCLVLAGVSNASALRPKGIPPQGGWKPGPGVTLGVSTAYVYGAAHKNAFSPGLEFSFFQKLRSPLSWWGTGGARMLIASETAVVPYVELGLNMLMLNLGTGYGVGMPGGFGHHHWNAFVGMSFPVYSQRRGRLFYIQGYYRPVVTFPTSQYGLSHEMGIMFKWMWAFHQNK